MSRGPGFRNKGASLKIRKPMGTSKPRAGSRRELVRLLDDEVRRIVRARDVTCVTPDAYCFGPLEISHYFRRGFQRIAWDLRNTNLQCQFHNQLHNTNRPPYMIYMVNHYGPGVYEELEASRQNQTPLTYSELETKLEELRAM